MVFILVRCSVHGALCQEELTAEPYVEKSYMSTDLVVTRAPYLVPQTLLGVQLFLLMSCGLLLFYLVLLCVTQSGSSAQSPC